MQTAKWLTTEHLALTPQVLAQGSWHRLSRQASFPSHSELRMHSGLHPVWGSPRYPFMHLQLTEEPSSRISHWALKPHLGQEIVSFW